MEVRTLASGSSGNCILLSGGGGYLLVDAGISCKRIAAALAEMGLTPDDLSGVLVTHEHSDHIAGIATLTKRFSLPVFTSPGTAERLCSDLVTGWQRVHTVSPGGSFELGGFGVETFPTSHDANEPMGFAISCLGRKAAVVTDLGYVSDEVLRGVLGCDLVVCESNHDVDWLKSGPYPVYLKSRILGNKGHLSNEAGAALALACVEEGARTVILAHLSNQNNTPTRALSVAESVLRGAGVEPGKDVTLTAAPRSTPSAVFDV